MPLPLYAFFFLLLISACGRTEQSQPDPINPVLAITGLIEMHKDFPSEFVEPRNVEVWLPEDYYSRPAQTYQALYMHDGQNVFNPETSYNGNDWMVDEAMTDLLRAGQVPSTIVVAVWNSGMTRFPEYMPQKPADVMNSESVQKQVIKNSGSAIFSDQYLRFLVEELKPFIDTEYRTRPEPAFTSIMGSSMGGLISLYAIMEYPEVFGAAGCISTHWIVPEIGDDFVNYVADHLPDPSTHKIYFDFGTEGLDANYEPEQTKIDAMMKAAGYTDGVNWITKKFEGHDHKEQYWAMRVKEPLQFILNP